jgi:uncharacterized coiled-coil protein SlyX
MVCLKITLRSLAIYGRQCRLAHLTPSTSSISGQLKDPIVGSVPALSSLVSTYATLLSRELPCRMAHQARTLRALPEKLMELSAVHRMNDRYQHSINRLHSFYKAPTLTSSGNDWQTSNPNTRSTLMSHSIDVNAFTDALTEEVAAIERDHRSLLSAIGHAVMENEEKNAIQSGNAIPSAIGQAFLDTSFQSLISMRLLYNHHQYGIAMMNASNSRGQKDDAWHMYGPSIAQPVCISVSSTRDLLSFM